MTDELTARVRERATDAACRILARLDGGKWAACPDTPAESPESSEDALEMSA